MLNRSSNRGVALCKGSRRSRGSSTYRRRTQLALGCALVALLACQGGAPRTPSETPTPDVQVGRPGSDGQCISLANIGSYRVLDERTLLLDVPPGQKVIEVYADCDNLRFAEDIGIEGRGGMVCDYRTDKLIVAGRACTIASIRDYDVVPDRIHQRRLDLNPEPALEGAL